MKKQLNSKELHERISDGDKRALSGKLERLRYLLSKEVKEEFPISALSYEYYEEARLCWYMGAFVATIVLSQLALEETLRAYFRMSEGVQGNLSSGKSVDQAGFSDLINEAKKRNIISESETQQLHRLRSRLRNPYVHPKDIDPKDYDANGNPAKVDFFKQSLKISSPNLIGESVVDEAKEAITILINFLPKISGRLYGVKV